MYCPKLLDILRELSSFLVCGEVSLYVARILCAIIYHMYEAYSESKYRFAVRKQIE